MVSQFSQRQWAGYEIYPTDFIMHFRDVLMNLYLKCHIRNSKGTLLTLYRTVLILVLMIYPSSAKRPGCERVGYTKRIQIEGCVEFSVTLNACRGYCESYAIPSPSHILNFNRKHIITSHAECCTIAKTQDRTFYVDCVDGERKLVFKSAVDCVCSVCRS